MTDQNHSLVKAAESIGASMKQISNSLAYLVVNSESLQASNRGDQAYMLHKLGYGNQEIASIVGSPATSVSTFISDRKRAESTKKEGKQKKSKK